MPIKKLMISAQNSAVLSALAMKRNNGFSRFSEGKAVVFYILCR